MHEPMTISVLILTNHWTYTFIHAF